MQKDFLLKSLVPVEAAGKIVHRSYKKDEFILSRGDKKIFYITSGEVALVRYEKNGERIFPYLFTEDEFLGVDSFLSTEFMDWEAIAFAEDITCFEIPEDIFKRYILPSPVFLEKYLPKSHRAIQNGVRGFYIFAQGDATAYFAYVLNYSFENFDNVSLKKYSDFTKVLSVSKACLYNITNKFIEEGIITKEKNRLYLKDKKKLRNYYREYVY